MVEKENKLVTDTGESQNENTPTKSIDDLVYAMNENEDSKEKNVLVLCAGGGTSGLLANALAKGAKEYNIPINSAAGSYGAHHDMMKDFDLIILAPQVASNYEDIKKDTDRLGIELVKTQGKEYISLTRDPKGALNFVMNILNTSNKEIDVKNIEGGI
ncbi:lactose/cellobiose PTS transporter subunit IIB [Carnobacterium viridans]